MSEESLGDHTAAAAHTHCIRASVHREGKWLVGPARVFQISAPGTGVIVDVDVPHPGPTDVAVRTLFSGISRGTETTVFTGRVPRSQYEVMRAPFQRGDFPGPVVYGYLNVGVVEQGPDALVGRQVFTLFPHQTRFVVPASEVIVLPDGVPARRAVLAGTVETAVNALWDAAPLIGDRVAVVGAGMVGVCVARLLARIPGVEVTLIDIDTSRAATAEALGVPFALPEGASGNCDLVVHTSGSSAGLQLSLDLLGSEGSVIELSWYGDRETTVTLGGSFHSSRLSIRASQVGAVAPARRARRSFSDRLGLALQLLQDNAFDAVLSGTSSFVDLPSVLPRIADGSLPALCHVIEYETEKG
jgi:threonine dehydrogenase-like Zn-dependent dehydrogenase